MLLSSAMQKTMIVILGNTVMNEWTIVLKARCERKFAILELVDPHIYSSGCFLTNIQTKI